eukprot:9476475-Pyramimonas_sp.AAC.1
MQASCRSPCVGSICAFCRALKNLVWHCSGLSPLVPSEPRRSVALGAGALGVEAPAQRLRHAGARRGRRRGPLDAARAACRGNALVLGGRHLFERLEEVALPLDRGRRGHRHVQGCELLVDGLDPVRACACGQQEVGRPVERVLHREVPCLRLDHGLLGLRVQDAREIPAVVLRLLGVEVAPQNLSGRLPLQGRPDARVVLAYRRTQRGPSLHALVDHVRGLGIHGHPEGEAQHLEFAILVPRVRGLVLGEDFGLDCVQQVLHQAVLPAGMACAVFPLRKAQEERWGTGGGGGTGRRRGREEEEEEEK